MMFNDIGKVLFEKLQELKQDSNGSFEMDKLDDIVAQFIEVMKSHINSDDDLQVFAELEKIQDRIKKAKCEFANINQHQLHKEFPDATQQLQFVIKTMEKSADDIMNATETIQNNLDKITDTEVKEIIHQSCFKIMESCSFQDLTGQKIVQIAKTLEEVELAISSIFKNLNFCNVQETIDVETKKTRNEEASLLNGPQLTEDKPSQKEIDDLFNNS